MTLNEIIELASKELSLELIGCCGKGAFGVVYLANDQIGRRVALKIVDKERLGENWEREYKGISNYCLQVREHSSLIEIYHVMDFHDYFCYTMEAADNFFTGDESEGKYCADTLGNRLNQGKKFSTDDMLRIAEDLLSGLEVLHSLGLIHRDIKPSNVVFVNGHAKLGDMGLLTRFTDSQSFAGTAEYLPPELFRQGNDAPKNDTEGDLYALGKVLYCILSGFPPSSFPELPAGILGNREILRLNKFLLKACSDDKSKRFTSIDSFRNALRDCCRPVSHAKNWLWAAGAAVFSAVLAMLSLTMRNTYSGNDKAETATPPTAKTATTAKKLARVQPMVLPKVSSRPVYISLEQRLALAEARLEELQKEGAISKDINIESIIETPKRLFAENPKDLRLAFRGAQVKCLEEKREQLQKQRLLASKEYDAAVNETFRKTMNDMLAGDGIHKQLITNYAVPQLRSGDINPNLKLTMKKSNGDEFEISLLQLFMSMPGSTEDICSLLLSLGANVDEALTPKYKYSLKGNYVIRNGAMDKMGGLLTPLIKQHQFYRQRPNLGNALTFPHAVISLLLRNHYVHELDKQGNSPLHYAVKIDSFRIAALLLCADADANLANQAGETPLMLASKLPNEDMKQLLLHFGADASKQDTGDSVQN